MKLKIWHFFTIILFAVMVVVISSPLSMSATNSQFLTDPFLQLPTPSSVRVVWFTSQAGTHHTVTYGHNLDRTVEADTKALSRTREDTTSHLEGNSLSAPTPRPIWRHEALVRDLIPGKRIPYYVTSIFSDGETVNSRVFSLSATPLPESPLKILLTSDHQLKPLTSANIQKVTETVGQVDAVFFAGDLVNTPDRASEWFDDSRGNAFFASLQGKANYELTKNGVTTTYQGGEIIQHAPLFLTIGNHEVMGRYSDTLPLDDQFSDAIPRAVAQKFLPENANETEIKNHSFNIDTVQEIFNFPNDNSYYAVTFGDIRLVVLYATNVWRYPSTDNDKKGKYSEPKQNLDNPQNWGYGQHIFEPIYKGSEQYSWLEKELNYPEFQNAKYKVVMLHHPPHSLGENIVPAYTNPVQIIERDTQGNITEIRYESPQDENYLIRDIIPLLESKKVQLVFYGHSHLWNHFLSPAGTHFLENSNVGNSYGAYKIGRAHV